MAGIESGDMWIRLVAAAMLLGGGRLSLAELSFDKAAIDQHRQIYDLSCVPSAVEIVLKLTGRVPAEYFELQEAWRNKADGSGKDFDAVSVAGLTFHQQFALPRKRGFPFKKLFATIDAELSAGRYVITGLPLGNKNFHAWVIVERLANGEYRAVSKAGADTIEVRNTRTIIRRMKGTDLLTYRPTAAR